MFVSDILEKLSLSPRSAHQSPLSTTDLYLFCTTKVVPKFLLPFQSQASFQREQFGSYDYTARSLSLVACSLTSQRSRMLMQKRPLFGGYILGLQPRDKAAILGVITRRIYMKIEFSSQRREILLFLTTNMTTVTSRANQQLTVKNRGIPLLRKLYSIFM